MDNIEIYISAIKSVLAAHGVDYDELDETFTVLDELFFQLSEARDEERIAEERREASSRRRMTMPYKQLFVLCSRCADNLAVISSVSLRRPISEKAKCRECGKLTWCDEYIVSNRDE